MDDDAVSVASSVASRGAASVASSIASSGIRLQNADHRQNIFGVVARFEYGALLEFVQGGFNVLERDPFAHNETLLHTATRAFFGQTYRPEFVLLVNEGIDINARDNKGNTPLHLAVDLGLWSLVKLFLLLGADPSIRSSAGISAIELERAHLSSKDFVAEWVMCAKDVSKRGLLREEWMGELAVLEYEASMREWAEARAAVEAGDTNKLDYIITKRGVDVNAHYDEYGGVTLLMSATAHSNHDMVIFLLESGADVSLRTIEGCTVLHFCVADTAEEEHQRMPILLTLLDAGANPTLGDDLPTPARIPGRLSRVQLGTPAQYAASYDCHEMARVLVAAEQEYRNRQMGITGPAGAVTPGVTRPYYAPQMSLPQGIASSAASEVESDGVTYDGRGGFRPSSGPPSSRGGYSRPPTEPQTPSGAASRGSIPAPVLVPSTQYPSGPAPAPVLSAPPTDPNYPYNTTAPQAYPPQYPPAVPAPAPYPVAAPGVPAAYPAATTYQAPAAYPSPATYQQAFPGAAPVQAAAPVYAAPPQQLPPHPSYAYSNVPAEDGSRYSDRSINGSISQALDNSRGATMGSRPVDNVSRLSRTIDHDVSRQSDFSRISSRAPDPRDASRASTHIAPVQQSMQSRGPAVPDPRLPNMELPSRGVTPSLTDQAATLLQQSVSALQQQPGAGGSRPASVPLHVSSVPPLAQSPTPAGQRSPGSHYTSTSRASSTQYSRRDEKADRSSSGRHRRRSSSRGREGREKSARESSTRLDRTAQSRGGAPDTSLRPVSPYSRYSGVTSPPEIAPVPQPPRSATKTTAPVNTVAAPLPSAQLAGPGSAAGSRAASREPLGQAALRSMRDGPSRTTDGTSTFTVSPPDSRSAWKEVAPSRGSPAPLSQSRDLTSLGLRASAVGPARDASVRGSVPPTQRSAAGSVYANSTVGATGQPSSRARTPGGGSVADSVSTAAALGVRGGGGAGSGASPAGSVRGGVPREPTIRERLGEMMVAESVERALTKAGINTEAEAEQVARSMFLNGFEDTLFGSARGTTPGTGKSRRLSLSGSLSDTKRFAVLPSDLVVGKCVRVNDSVDGIIRYLGPTFFGGGMWVGVELLFPVGKHDGRVYGYRYFKCKPSHGVFVRPNKITYAIEPKKWIPAGV